MPRSVLPVPAPGPDVVRPSGRLETFHPGWFGAVMGTSITAVAVWENPGEIGALDGTAQVAGETVLLLALGFAVVLGVPTLLRWVYHPRSAWRDFGDPVTGALYATVPGGLLSLAAAIAVVEPSYLPAESVDPIVATVGLAGAVLGFVGSLAFVTIVVTGEDLAPDTVNGGWIIPPVVNILVPLVAAPLAEGADPTTQRLLVVLGYAALGIGLFLFLLVAGLLFGRMVFHRLPPPGLAPSLWIVLGPLGVGALALLALADAGGPLWGEAADAVSAVSLIAASLLWGFGLWWLLAASLLLAVYLRTGPLPYGLSWWAFTFPLGAFTVSTAALADAWDVGALEGMFAVLFLLTATAWVTVSGRTLGGLHSGEVWRRPSPSMPARAR